MVDEIIRELWEIKDKIAREYGHNLDAYFTHLRNLPKSENHPVVNLQAEKKSKKPPILDEIEPN